MHFCKFVLIMIDVDAFCTFPQVPVTGGGQSKQGRDTASVAGCHSGFRGSSSTQLLMPCYPPAIHHSSLRVRYALPSNPPPHHPHPPSLAPSIPHFPLWISAADSCQDCTDVHKHPPTTYVHVFVKLLSISFQSRVTLHVCL